VTALRDVLAELGTAHDFTGAPCIGRHELFDPADGNEHADVVLERHGRAVALCALCPLEHVAACAALERTIPKPHRAGVWAGASHDHKETR
jgi:Transcription factor WhiB